MRGSNQLILESGLLEYRELPAYYADSHVLHGVDMDVPDGTCVALIGRNGAGKTTTLRALLGYVTRSGRILFRGTDITRLPPYAIVRLGISYVPEDRGIFPSLTVEEHLQLSRYAARRRACLRDIAEIFELFPRLAERRRNLGGALSGGEQQMLAIGRALIQGPDLLVLDEPTEGLAPAIIEAVLDSLKRIRRQGTTMLLVEQNYHFTISLADQVYVMSQGAVRFHGTPAALSASEQVRKEYLGI